MLIAGVWNGLSCLTTRTEDEAKSLLISPSCLALSNFARTWRRSLLEQGQLADRAGYTIEFRLHLQYGKLLHPYQQTVWLHRPGVAHIVRVGLHATLDRMTCDPRLDLRPARLSPISEQARLCCVMGVRLWRNQWI
jgi:hypothetical protein